MNMDIDISHTPNRGFPMALPSEALEQVTYPRVDLPYVIGGEMHYIRARCTRSRIEKRRGRSLALIWCS